MANGPKHHPQVASSQTLQNQQQQLSAQTTANISANNNSRKSSETVTSSLEEPDDIRITSQIQGTEIKSDMQDSVTDAAQALAASLLEENSEILPEVTAQAVDSTQEQQTKPPKSIDSSKCEKESLNKIESLEVSADTGEDNSSVKKVNYFIFIQC
jgi:hypothetical protein